MYVFRIPRHAAAVLSHVFFGLAVTDALADPSVRETAGICEKAAIVAAHESGIPLDVLRAISLTETGRKVSAGFLPWPWTVNMEGAGKWFDTRPEARTYVDRHFARGARSFDIGCFQINYRWHGHAFSSIEEMFDPLANARYAASFLGDLYGEFGDWSRAAGAYHSRTPKYASKYAARFDRIRARLPATEPIVTAVVTPPRAITPVEAVVRVNRFPLLQAGTISVRGSLVPVNAPSTGHLFDRRPAAPLLEMR